MTDKLKQTIKEEISRLPKSTQQAISSLDWVSIAEDISKKYFLNESETNDFEVETLLVLVGLEEPDSYERNIENKVGATKDEAGKMASEAIEKIFTPIYNTLTENIKKNMQNKNPNWQQSVDFILSGGDYSAFMETPRRENSPLEEHPLGGGGQILPPRLGATPQEGNK